MTRDTTDDLEQAPRRHRTVPNVMWGDPRLIGCVPEGRCRAESSDGGSDRRQIRQAQGSPPTIRRCLGEEMALGGGEGEERSETMEFLQPAKGDLATIEPAIYAC